jgi:hypothetical protein
VLTACHLTPPQGVEKRVRWVTITRVCGELSVSRSIGDPDFKGFGPSEGEPPEFPFNFPEGHSGVFYADLIIADPEFHDIELTEEVGEGRRSECGWCVSDWWRPVVICAMSRHRIPSSSWRVMACGTCWATRRRSTTPTQCCKAAPVPATPPRGWPTWR